MWGEHERWYYLLALSCCLPQGALNMNGMGIKLVVFASRIYPPIVKMYPGGERMTYATQAGPVT